MVKVISIVVLIIVGFALYWIYLGFFRPLPELPTVAKELESHFKKFGLKVSPKTIRQGYHDLVAQVEYDFEDYPLGISLSICKSVVSANKHFASIQDNPNLNFPVQKGNLILFLVYWEESDLTNKVLEAFGTFNPNT